jgi:general stress protein YciG
MKSFFTTMLLAASVMAIRLNAPTEGEIRQALKDEGIDRAELERLCDANPDTCAEAREAIEGRGKLAQTGDDSEADEVVRRLRDAGADSEDIERLGRIARKGGKKALKQACADSPDQCAMLKEAVLAQTGDDSEADEVVRRLRDAGADSEDIERLGRIARKGGKKALKQACADNPDQCAMLKEAVLAQTGDDSEADEVVRRLRDAGADSEDIERLGKIARKGGKKALKQACADSPDQCAMLKEAVRE